ncbi:MAG: hypothetical protein AAGJ34_06555 [Pseudomonadota bacterium]
MTEEKKFSRAKLDAAQRKVYSLFRRRPNFTGADVGYRWNGDKKTKELVVRIHVNAKIPVAELDEKDVFPAEIDGIPLDVIEGPYKIRRSAGSPQDRAKILTGGISVGRLDNSAGTLGTIVMVEETEQPAILSNWHVIAGANAQRGDGILQPGRADGGGFDDDIANLFDWKLNRFCDAAIALLNRKRPWLPVQFRGFTNFEGDRTSRLGEVLTKYGRTTGKTRARVDGEGVYRVFYEVKPGVIEPRDIDGFKLVPEAPDNPGDVEVSEGGDSGSVWFNENDKTAVGLHFAGESDTDPLAERAIACNMPSVLQQLKIRFATFEDLEKLTSESSGFGQSWQISRRGTDRPDFTPAPHVPFPTHPPFPFPHPWPIPRPWPYPYHHDLDGPLADPRERQPNWSAMSFSNLAETSGTAEQISDSVFWDMMHRLERSLVVRHGSRFSNLDPRGKITDRIRGNWPYEIAVSVMNGRFFNDALPYFPPPPFYETSVVWAHVAQDLADLAQRRP